MTWFLVFYLLALVILSADNARQRHKVTALERELDGMQYGDGRR